MMLLENKFKQSLYFFYVSKEKQYNLQQRRSVNGINYLKETRKLEIY